MIADGVLSRCADGILLHCADGMLLRCADSILLRCCLNILFADVIPAVGLVLRNNPTVRHLVISSCKNLSGKVLSLIADCLGPNLV